MKKSVKTQDRVGIGDYNFIHVYDIIMNNETSLVKTFYFLLFPKKSLRIGPVAFSFA